MLSAPSDVCELSDRLQATTLSTHTPPPPPPPKITLDAQIATLDSQMFPHILDAVVDFAPPEVLLSLRATSKSVHCRADNRLFNHIELVKHSASMRRVPLDWEEDPQNDPVVISARPVGSSLLFEWRRYLEIPMTWSPTLVLPVHFPGENNDGDLHRAKLREYIQKRVVEAAVVDTEASAVGWDVEPFDLERSQRIHKALCLRDRRPLRCLGYRTMTTILTPGGSPGVEMAQAALFRPSEVVRGGPLIMPEILSDHRTMQGSNVLHLLKANSELVPRPTSGTLDPTSTSPATASITVVGGGEAMRSAVGLPPTASHSQLIDASTAALLEYGNQEGLNLSPWCGVFRFLTPQEYLAEVGPEQVALETQLDPYSGPPAEYIK